MAKYWITYKCGHEVEKQLFGKISERENYISWAEEQLCPACQRKIHHDKALADAATNGYPELEGSEKQVTWAIDLRYTFVKNVEAEIKEKRDRLERISENEEEKNARLTKFEKFLPEFYEVMNNLLANKTSAKFWIDNREYIEPGKYEWEVSLSPMELIRKFKKEMEQENLG